MQQTYAIYLFFLFAVSAGCFDASTQSSNAQKNPQQETPSPIEEPQQSDHTPSVNPQCEENGCLRWALFLGDFSRSYLESSVPYNVVIDNGYSIWQIGYWTSNQEARATLAIPYNAPVPEEGWPMAVNNPGTVGVGDPCALSNSILAAGLAGYFGARGFIGITLDYPGLGTPADHPYLVSTIAGRAGLDSIRATLQFADRFALSVSSKAVMAGLSQGGHTTFAAAAMHANYAPELDIRAYSVSGPASVFPQHWSPHIQTPGEHLVYHALLAYSWSSYYGHLGQPIWAEEITDSITEIMENHCIASTTSATLSEKLGPLPSEIFSEEYLLAYSSGNFENYPFLEQGFAENRVKAFTQDSPIRFYQGELDNVVLAADSQELVNHLEEEGMTIELIIKPNGEHTNIAFSFLGVFQLATEDAIVWLKSHL